MNNLNIHQLALSLRDLRGRYSVEDNAHQNRARFVLSNHFSGPGSSQLLNCITRHTKPQHSDHYSTTLVRFYYFKNEPPALLTCSSPFWRSIRLLGFCSSLLHSPPSRELTHRPTSSSHPINCVEAKGVGGI